MRVLAACEESQEVTKAFRVLGHEAYSCDIAECSGGHPEWHFQTDVRELLSEDWDMILAFPPCTYMTSVGARHMFVKGEIQPERYQKMLEARDFFMLFYENPCPRVCIENPTPFHICELPPYTQIIHPWMFGAPYMKRTCLWLKGLPKLIPAFEDKPAGTKSWVASGKGAKSGLQWDQKMRSKTFPEIAQAMADQWGRQPW